jgi:hypothetical protein
VAHVLISAFRKSKSLFKFLPTGDKPTDNKDFVKLAILHNHFFHFKQRLSSVIIQPCQEDEPDAVVVALR